MTEIHLSVRELVEFTRMQGDIDNRFKGFEAAKEGAELHRKLQKSEPAGYQSEVSIRGTIELEDTVFFLSGRADGLFERGGEIYIDEIKSTAMPLHEIRLESMPLHFEQAAVYGFLWMKENHLSHIHIRLRYVHRGSEQIRDFEQKLDFETATALMLRLTARYLDIYRLLAEIKKRRNESLNNLAFPYGAYRKDQRKFCVAVYRSIEAEKNIFIQAPTGTGKTISTLFPALKSMGAGWSDKIFYATAKTLTQKVADSTLKDMEKKGLRLKRVWLTAKEKVCFKEHTRCRPDYCEYAKGYYQRLSVHLYDIFKAHGDFHRENIAQIAQTYQLCPFELSLDLARLSDLILCDYNYVFDPKVALKYLSEETQGRDVYLVDEGHNLVDRAREMYSAALSKKDFWDTAKLYKDTAPKLYKAFYKVNRAFNDAFREREDEKEASKEFCHDFEQALFQFKRAMEKHLSLAEDEGEEEQNEEALARYFEVVSFLKMAEFFGPHYQVLYHQENKDKKIKLFCLDPGPLLATAFQRARASVIFSATLTPIDYFRAVLGGAETDYVLGLSSPFDPKNLGVFILKEGTKYQERSKTAPLIAAKITEAYLRKPGNYMVFFPSYAYLEQVYGHMADEKLPIVKQERAMEDADKEQMLQLFHEKNENLLFAVMGSHFSEGINLVGERLIGVFIVGVGLPALSFESDLIRDYYEKTTGHGFDFAYRYPGMNKVLQACGRVIRTEEDRGILCLIDERYLNFSYRRCFPNHWQKIQVMKEEQGLEEALDSFWGDQDA